MIRLPASRRILRETQMRLEDGDLISLDRHQLLRAQNRT
jgi:hypothetical protein